MAVSIHCPFCHQKTALRCAQTAYSRGAYGESGSVNTAWQSPSGGRWWIGICNGCDRPMLVLKDGDIIYPNPTPSPTDPLVPKELATDLDEAKRCFSVEAYRACATLARRCIQQACMMKGAKTGDLVAQIKELTSLAIITKDVEEWATVVRWVGNDAAHPGKDLVTKEDAEDVLKLAEQFLHVIFVTPAIAKARRAARGK